MKTIISLISFVLGLVINIHCQNISGIIYGENEPLPYANILLLDNAFEYTDGVISDQTGTFTFTDYDKRAAYITASYVGFNNADTILLSKANISQLTIQLVANPNVIACPVIESYPYHYFSTIDQDVISIKGSHPGLAATFNDPTRSLIRYPGFSATNDQANNYSYRGMPSEFLSWRLDGAEIINPNHLSNAGTLSDRPSANAGGVMMIPFEALDAFKFHGSTYSKSYNNAIGGITELNPINDVSGKSNFLKLGFLGLEAGIANHHESNKSFAVHDIYAQYRYSFTGLLSDFGVDFDGEEIKYQDAFVRAKVLSKDQLDVHTTFIFGNSKNEEANVSTFSSESYITGLTLTKKDNSGDQDLIMSLFYSQQTDERIAYNYPTNTAPPANSRVDFQPSNIKKLSFHLDSKVLDRQKKSLNVFLNTSYNDEDFIWRSSLEEGPSSDGTAYYQRDDQFINGSVGAAFKKSGESSSLTIELSNTFTLDEAVIPEGRIAWSLYSKRAGLNLSVAKSSQLPQRYIAGLLDMPVVLNTNTIPTQNNITKTVKSLSANLGFDIKAKSNKNPFSASLNLFAQYIYDLPISTEFDVFDPYTGIDFLFPTQLVSDGSAFNYGVELRSHVQLPAKWQLDMNGSIFENKYSRASTQSDFNSPFNYNYIGNLLITKRFFFGQKMLFGSLAFHVRDRNLFPGIDLSASREQGLTVYKANFQKRGSVYHRLDLRLRYEFGKNQLILDIQNIMNRQDPTFRYYNAAIDTIEQNTRLGLIPILSYKRLF